MDNTKAKINERYAQMTIEELKEEYQDVCSEIMKGEVMKTRNQNPYHRESSKASVNLKLLRYKRLAILLRLKDSGYDV